MEPKPKGLDQRDVKPETSILLTGFLTLASISPIPTEEDFLYLAEELEENPPTDLSPDALSQVVKILRGEEIDPID